MSRDVKAVAALGTIVTFTVITGFCVWVSRPRSPTGAHAVPSAAPPVAPVLPVASLSPPVRDLHWTSEEIRVLRERRDAIRRCEDAGMFPMFGFDEVVCLRKSCVAWAQSTPFPE